jgi:hypothetical protein
MPPQVGIRDFEKAMTELGHDPDNYRGKKLSLEGMSELYEIEVDAILDAIKQKAIGAHYDYLADTIWIDALDAAHFYFCVRSEGQLLDFSA